LKVFESGFKRQQFQQSTIISFNAFSNWFFSRLDNLISVPFSEKERVAWPVGPKERSKIK